MRQLEVAQLKCQQQFDLECPVKVVLDETTQYFPRRRKNSETVVKASIIPLALTRENGQIIRAIHVQQHQTALFKQEE